MSKIVLVESCDGYKGLYVNGKLEAQGGHLDVHYVLRQLASKRRRVDSFENPSVDEEWFDYENEYPDDLNDVVLDDG